MVDFALSDEDSWFGLAYYELCIYIVCYVSIQLSQHVVAKCMVIIISFLMHITFIFICHTHRP